MGISTGLSIDTVKGVHKEGGLGLNPVEHTLQKLEYLRKRD